jgi:hypothetical protein
LSGPARTPVKPHLLLKLSGHAKGTYPRILRLALSKVLTLKHDEHSELTHRF